MPREIEQLIAELRRVRADITVEQLRIAHPGADDDGLWFVSHPAAAAGVQVESSTGAAPFLVESDHEPPAVAHTVEDAVRMVVRRLALDAGTV